MLVAAAYTQCSPMSGEFFFNVQAHVYFAPCVLTTLFQSSLAVSKSVVCTTGLTHNISGYRKL